METYWIDAPNSCPICSFRAPFILFEMIMWSSCFCLRPFGCSTAEGREPDSTLRFFADDFQRDPHQPPQLLVARAREQRLRPQVRLGRGVAVEEAAQERHEGDALQVRRALPARAL